jgi:hypothetical protein
MANKNTTSSKFLEEVRVPHYAEKDINENSFETCNQRIFFKRIFNEGVLYANKYDEIIKGAEMRRFTNLESHNLTQLESYAQARLNLCFKLVQEDPKLLSCVDSKYHPIFKSTFPTHWLEFTDTHVKKIQQVQPKVKQYTGNRANTQRSYWRDFHGNLRYTENGFHYYAPPEADNSFKFSNTNNEKHSTTVKQTESIYDCWKKWRDHEQQQFEKMYREEEKEVAKFKQKPSVTKLSVTFDSSSDDDDTDLAEFYQPGMEDERDVANVNDIFESCAGAPTAKKMTIYEFEKRKEELYKKELMIPFKIKMAAKSLVTAENLYKKCREFKSKNYPIELITQVDKEADDTLEEARQWLDQLDMDDLEALPDAKEW